MQGNYIAPATQRKQQEVASVCRHVNWCEQSAQNHFMLIFFFSPFHIFAHYYFIISFEFKCQNVNELPASAERTTKLRISFVCFLLLSRFFFFPFSRLLAVSLFFSPRFVVRSSLSSTSYRFLRWQARTAGQNVNFCIIICLFTSTNDKLDEKWKSSRTCKKHKQMQNRMKRPFSRISMRSFWWSSERGRVMREHGRVRFNFNWNQVFFFLLFISFNITHRRANDQMRARKSDESIWYDPRKNRAQRNNFRFAFIRVIVKFSPGNEVNIFPCNFDFIDISAVFWAYGFAGGVAYWRREI